VKILFFKTLEVKNIRVKFQRLFRIDFFLLYLLLRRERYYLRARDEMIMVYYSVCQITLVYVKEKARGRGVIAVTIF